MSEENERDDPEQSTPNFFDDAEEPIQGIFGDKENPAGSFGDPDAVEDLRAHEKMAMITFTGGSDGLPTPSPAPDAMKYSGRVTKHKELVCLVGPCEHYGERFIEVGKKPDGTPYIEVERFCLRMASWAEPQRLKDAEVVACSGHEVSGPVSHEDGALIQKNLQKIADTNKSAIGNGHDLGVCHLGACRNYIVVVRRAIEDDGFHHTRPKRFCLKFAGAARLKEVLSYQPTHGCSHLDSTIADRLTRLRVMERNEKALSEMRDVFARRKEDIDGGQGEDGDSDSGTGEGQHATGVEGHHSSGGEAGEGERDQGNS